MLFSRTFYRKVLLQAHVTVRSIKCIVFTEISFCFKQRPDVSHLDLLCVPLTGLLTTGDFFMAVGESLYSWLRYGVAFHYCVFCW